MPITIPWPVDLPEVRVLASQVLEDATLLIQVESPRQTTQGHRCGREIDRFHGFDQPIRLRHLPVLGREVFIELRPKRYRCPFGEGEPTTTQGCAWYDPHRPHTKAFEQGVLKRLVHSTVADGSRQVALGVKAVEAIVDHEVATTVDGAAFTALETLGIDEGAWCKGQGHYGAVVWARDALANTPIVAVLPKRLQATVQAFLETIPAALKATVRRVCIDLGEGYAGAVAAALPAAEVVVDRFHVAVQYRQAVADLRQQECRRLNAGRPADQALPTAERRSFLRREWSSLKQSQQDQVVNLFPQSPTLANAYLLRMLLTASFECSPDRGTAQTRLQPWGELVKAAGITCLDKLLTTLQHWQDGILNYFEGRHSSGFVEGLNNKLKLLKRRCFGLDAPVELFRRLWLAIEGPRLWV